MDPNLHDVAIKMFRAFSVGILSEILYSGTNFHVASYFGIFADTLGGWAKSLLFLFFCSVAVKQGEIKFFVELFEIDVSLISQSFWPIYDL